MLNLRHPHTNAEHGKPKDWDETTMGECFTLPTVSDETGHTSFFTPTPEELARLNAGGSVALTIYCTPHPVIRMDVLNWPEQRFDADGQPLAT